MRRRPSRRSTIRRTSETAGRTRIRSTQLPLRPDRIEKLQKRGPQQPLRRNGRTSTGLVKRRKRSVEIRQRRVGQPSHRPQRMLRRDPRLDVDVREQRPTRPILASHRSLAIRLDNPTNHAKRRNTSDFSGDFFSSLLEQFGPVRPLLGPQAGRLPRKLAQPRLRPRGWWASQTNGLAPSSAS